jgi:16S rRNA (adenine1518-N6/adenine1519-N6)-dimethyltransferase
MRSEVRKRLRELRIQPSKKLGQNFLVDEAALRAIERAVDESDPRTLVEIGPGLGAVTRRLAKPGRRVIALEVDHRLARALTDEFVDDPSVEIRDQDALTFGIGAEVPEGDAFVCGSIPYSLTTPILRYLVKQRAFIREALLLTQKEVASKIAASPGKDGTALGVLVRGYADVEILRHVGRSGFVPEPDVDSALWRLRFLDRARFANPPEAFFSVVRTLYGARRKMLRRALRGLVSGEAVDALVRGAELDGTVRGETLGFDELDRLTSAWLRLSRTARPLGDEDRCNVIAADCTAIEKSGTESKRRSP